MKVPMLPPFFVFFDWLLFVLLIQVSIVDQKENNENGGSDHIWSSDQMDSCCVILHGWSRALFTGPRPWRVYSISIVQYCNVKGVGLFCFFVDCAGENSFMRLESTEKKQRRLTSPTTLQWDSGRVCVCVLLVASRRRLLLVPAGSRGRLVMLSTRPDHLVMVCCFFSLTVFLWG